MREVAVRVTDLNEWVMGPIRDGFDGVLYTFERNQPVTIPLSAARHIFGCDESGKPDPSYIQRRWGWNTPESIKESSKWLQNIKIEPVTLETVELAIDPDAEVGEDATPAKTMIKRGRPSAQAAIDAR